ncbi:MAG: hypothetical protein QHH09_02355 [Microgenomates group bacterium]|nr:hypothetical protein [Microgenomates group bacterium]
MAAERLDLSGIHPKILFLSEAFFYDWVQIHLRWPWGLLVVHQNDRLSQKILNQPSPVDQELVRELIFFGQSSEAEFKKKVKTSINGLYQEMMKEEQSQEESGAFLKNISAGMDFLDSVFAALSDGKRRTGESKASHACRTLMYFLLRARELKIVSRYNPKWFKDPESLSRLINIGLLAALFHDAQEDISGLNIKKNDHGNKITFCYQSTLEGKNLTCSLDFSTQEEIDLFLMMLDGLTKPEIKETNPKKKSKRQFTHLLEKAEEIRKKYSDWGRDAALILLLVKDADRTDNVYTDMVLRDDGYYYLQQWPERRKKLIEGLVWFRLMIKQIERYFKENSRINGIHDFKNRLNPNFILSFFTMERDKALIAIVAQLVGVRPEAIFHAFHLKAKENRKSGELVIPGPLFY